MLETLTRERRRSFLPPSGTIERAREKENVESRKAKGRSKGRGKMNEKGQKVLIICVLKHSRPGDNGNIHNAVFLLRTTNRRWF